VDEALEFAVGRLKDQISKEDAAEGPPTLEIGWVAELMPRFLHG